MDRHQSEFRYRPLERADIGDVPVSCHGTREQVVARIAKIGSSAMLAFEGADLDDLATATPCVLSFEST